MPCKKIVIPLAAAALACPVMAGQSDFERIDAHVHVLQVSPEYYRMLGALNLRVINVCVLDKYDAGFEAVAPQQATAQRAFRESKHKVAWCATFDPGDWEKHGFAREVERSLDERFRQGAVAVKIYKS
ncbi:MAG: hypothetical protein ABFD86_01975, partial [Bryobacteraceae bacterium]